jgi:hypothetical protein
MRQHGKTIHPRQPHPRQEETHADRTLISPSGSEHSLQLGAKVRQLKPHKRLVAQHEVSSRWDRWSQPDQVASHEIKETGRLTSDGESTDSCLVAILILTESVALLELPT